MFSFVGNAISNNGAKFLADFFAVIYGAVGHAVGNTVMNILGWIWNFVSTIIWYVCQWVLGFLDAMQLAFSRILGLDLQTGTSTSLGEYIDGMKEITISGGSNYYDYIMKIFRAMFVVGVILMIIFTIAAIVLQEYNLAVNGYQKSDNNKGKFVKNILTNMLSILLIPLIFYTIIIGTNSILSSFYRALGGYSDTTIAGNVLAASTYDANRYRAYANANKRIPITISVYSMDNAFGKAKGDEELKSEIQNDEVQEKLKAIAGCFAEDSFLPFEKSSMYLNGSWSNYSNYSITHNNTVYEDMGQYFENFVCTREQYYVLADFVDYCQLYGIKYYVKAMSESDICWKYVDALEVDTDIDSQGNALKDLTINIKYRNAETVNNPAEVEIEDPKQYKELQITTKLDLTSPIADALTTASTLLGIDKSNSSFNVMERDDSGDFVNLVEWSNRKAKLKLSTSFSLVDSATWTYFDQIIVYEYFRFQNDFASTNNTLEDYTLTQLKNEGAFIDVLEMKYRNYNSNTETYSSEHTQYCIKLNGNYYRVEESLTEFDDYGQAYFELNVPDKNTSYYQGSLITIEKVGTKSLKLTSSFDINNISAYLNNTATPDWGIQDQILLYEYFKDLSLSNGLRRTNKFSDFKTGVDFYIYQVGGSNYYLYINGTYYQCDSSGNLENDKDFLKLTSAVNERFFEFSHAIPNADNYGIGSGQLANIVKLNSELTEITSLNENNAMYQKFLSTNLKFSEKFSFYNTDTWTFRDFAIMYLYASKLAVDKNITITSLQVQGLSGNIVNAKCGGVESYYLEISYNVSGSTAICYLNLDSFYLIPEQLINTSISSTQFNDLGLGVSAFNFVKYYDANDMLINPNALSQISSKKFELSENFDAYDARTWSVGDFLMMYLIDCQIINTTIDIVKLFGYSTLCYTIGGQNYYRFGKQGASDAFFLNESHLNSMGYSVEKFFNSNLISFILSTQYNGYNASDLVVEDEDFANGTVADASTYLYNINGNITDTRNLQKQLAQDFLRNDLVIHDISEMEYSYSNPSINPSDPSTWRVLDILIFMERGSLPTGDMPFTSYLYNDGTNTYMKLANGFVNISSGATQCRSNGGTILTHRIISENATQFEEQEEFLMYYNTRLKGMVFNSITGDPAGKCYYYSQFYNSGSSYLSEMRYDFDFILANNGVSAQSNGYYTFDLVKSGDELYAKIATNIYVKLSSSSSSIIYYETNSLTSEITTDTKAFTVGGSYNPFADAEKYNRLDALIYSITGAVLTGTQFKIYASNVSASGEKFLFVSNKFLKYDVADTDSTNATITYTLNTTNITSQQIEMLYNNYYHSYVQSESPSAKEVYSFPIGVGFTNKALQNCHGLTVICAQLGVTSLTGNSLIESSNGKFYVKVNSPSAGIKYIDLSKLLDVTLEKYYGQVSSITINVSSRGQEDFRWLFARINGMTSPATFTQPTFITINNSLYSSGVNNEMTLDSGLSDARDKAKNTNIGDWTWLGLISNYLMPTVPPSAVAGNLTIESQRANYNVYKYYLIGVGEYYYFKRSGSNYFVRNQIGSGSSKLEDSFVNTNTNKTYQQVSYPTITGKNIEKILQSSGMASAVGQNAYNAQYITNVLNDFYVIKKDGVLYAIYGLPHALDPVAGSTGLQCVKVDGVDGYGAIDAELVDENDGSYFTLTSLELSKLKDWTMFDLVVSYAKASVFGSAFSTKIYYYGHKFYIQNQGKFILLPILGTNSDDSNNINKLNDVLHYNSSENKIINSGTDVSYKDSLIQLVRNENDSDLTNRYISTRVELSGVDVFETALTDAKAENTSDKPFQRINFSDNFKYNDYSTWTYSDFVIYYAYSNGFYVCPCNTVPCTHNIVSYELPFSYVSTFGYSADNYFNLTYLDIVLAKIFGEAATPAGSPVPIYTYLTGGIKRASYDFTLVYSGIDYYLRFRYGADNYYIPLSADISVDFSKMKINSLEIKPLMNSTEVHSKVLDFTSNDSKYYKTTEPASLQIVYTNFVIDNFQSFVNANCAPTQVYYLLDQDINTGSVEVSKVINFAFSDNAGKQGQYFDYNKFYDFYKEYINNHLSLINRSEDEKLSVTVHSTMPVTGNLVAKLNYDGIYPDFIFDDYYYYSLKINTLMSSNILSVDPAFEDKIRNDDLKGSALEKKIVNLRLSSNSMNPGNWTLLDYIILYELSRDDVKHNALKGMTVKELSESDYYYTVYYFDDDNDEVDPTTYAHMNDDPIYLYINNNIYKLTGIVEWDKDKSIFKGVNTKISYYNGSSDAEKFNAGTEDAPNNIAISDLVGTGDVNSFDFKVLHSSYEISIDPAYNYSKQYAKNKNNTMFTENNKTYYIEIDTNVVDTNYRINVASFGKYSTTTLIKKTSWVEKLMTDMQVYYPDLNWGVLLATDGWLDTLGEFTSANINGLFTGGQNSSNTTAAGLVLSEFFMSVATEVDGGYAEYEYSSAFDKDTIRALMLSLMGEENYQALVFEAEVFMDYFNSCFAPIIDDFAEEFGEKVNENSLRLNAYKSYLATLLLSSDIGEYLYTIATRVYAEYTIGEYLAAAAGDYVGYYNYANMLRDEDGNIVEAFNYGTFIELVRYENKYCGETNPVFTFNFRKAFAKYQSGGRVNGFTLEQALANDYYFDYVARTLFNNIDKEYETQYKAGYYVNEYGNLIDKNGKEAAKDGDYIYCYMLHVYHHIFQEVDEKENVTYLNCYRQYLDGNLTRWTMIKGQNIQTADQYIEPYEKTKDERSLSKFTSIVSSLALLLPSITIEERGEGWLLQYLIDSILAIKDNAALPDPGIRIDLPLLTAKYMMNDVSLTQDIKFIESNLLTLFATMTYSEDSDDPNQSGSSFFKGLAESILEAILPVDINTESCWNTIQRYYEAIENVTSELQEVRGLLPGESTEKGSLRKESYTDEQLDAIITAFVNVRTNLQRYIIAQEKIDMVKKKSITFTLAQYASNYVTSGYKFSIKNKEYTFKPETDPLRLAEYVYGGAFLEEIGEGSKYTDPEFTGIVKAAKIYDNVDKVLKTKLDTWSELRGFLSTIADQTAELYYTTNLGDLDISTTNKIELQDSITITGTVISESISIDCAGTSIEQALFKLIASYLNREIVYRLLGLEYDYDPSATNPVPDYNDPKIGHNGFVTLSLYLFGGDIPEEAFKNMTLESFKRYAMNTIIRNEQNQAESADERAAKYMLVYSILGIQVDLSANGQSLKRKLYGNRVRKDTTDPNNVKAYYIFDNGSDSEISGSIRMSNSTLDSVKILSGLENRPTREILTRQYEGIRPGDYYDEAFGDIFIACTYKDGLYYPIIGSASRNVSGYPLYNDYISNSGLINHKFISNYYDNTPNLVVMKGIITADGYPTAIRKYNNPIEIMQKQMFNTTTETYNAVTYYRTNVGANFGAGKDLVDASKAMSRVTTKNYTKYVNGTSFTKGIGSTVTYTGRTNLRTIGSSDYSAHFVQARAEYLMGQADDVGAISVLDDFSYFYLFGGQTWLLLMLAFVTIIPVMINAVGGAAARVLDTLVLFIVSPIVISTNSLYDGKNPIYKKWRKNVESVAMSAFGYILAFSSFSLLVPMVYGVNSFVGIETFNKIISIGGLSFVTYPMINGLVRALWVITAATLIDKIPKLLLPIITANRGDIQSPDPGLGSGAGKKFTDKVQGVVKAAKDVRNVLNGRALMGFMENMKDEALNLMPGYNLAKAIVSPSIDRAKKKKADKESALIEKGLKAYGIDAKVAKEAGKAVQEAAAAKKKAKDAKKKRMQEYKKDFQNVFSMVK